MKLITLDWLIIASYFALSLAVGLYYARRAGRSTEEYFLSDRSMPWWLAGTSMVATTFAADTPLAVTEMVARNGVAGNGNLRSPAGRCRDHAHRNRRCDSVCKIRQAWQHLPEATPMLDYAYVYGPST